VTNGLQTSHIHELEKEIRLKVDGLLESTVLETSHIHELEKEFVETRPLSWTLSLCGSFQRGISQRDSYYVEHEVLLKSKHQVYGMRYRVRSKVIKTGPDRPVQPVRPGTGQLSGSVYLQNRTANEPDIKPVNRTKPDKNRRFFS
jgi:hypothetical protein